MITLSLSILNTYENGDVFITCVTDAVVPDPPARTGRYADADTEREALNEWANMHIHDYTRTDRPDGAAWYDVTVTTSTDPDLIGVNFEFGY